MATSHKQTRRSLLAVARVLLSGANATLVTIAVCAWSVASDWPVAACHSRTVPSTSPVATVVPSGERAMAYAPGQVDVVLLVAMIVCMAIEIALFTGLTRAAAQGRREESRLPTYRYFIVYQWLLVGWIVVVWFVERRPWSVLSLGMPSPIGFGVCFALAVLHMYVAFKQAPVLLKRMDEDESMRAKISSVEGITPRTAEERRVWPLAAITGASGRP